MSQSVRGVSRAGESKRNLDSRLAASHWRRQSSQSVRGVSRAGEGTERVGDFKTPSVIEQTQSQSVRGVSRAGEGTWNTPGRCAVSIRAPRRGACGTPCACNDGLNPYAGLAAPGSHTTGQRRSMNSLIARAVRWPSQSVRGVSRAGERIRSRCGADRTALKSPEGRLNPYAGLAAPGRARSAIRNSQPLRTSGVLRRLNPYAGLAAPGRLLDLSERGSIPNRSSGRSAQVSIRTRG
jgi:hypothetical protein